MSPRLTIERSSPEELVLSGVIDEHARLHEVVTPEHRRLVLDLGDVTFINSLGVRDWIRFLAKLAADRIQLELVRVAEPLVHQFNMIVATRNGAQVRSFFAPFACDACGLEKSICLEVQPNLQALRALRPPDVACPTCRAPMAFNDFPERYFSFLRD